MSKKTENINLEEVIGGATVNMAELSPDKAGLSLNIRHKKAEMAKEDLLLPPSDPSPVR